MSYKLNSIYIIDTYKVVYKDPYYDYDSDEYLQDIYYEFNGLNLISMQDNKYIDVVDSKEMKLFSENLKQNDIFLGNTYPVRLSEYVEFDDLDIVLTRGTLIKIKKLFIPILEKKLKFLKESLYMSTTLFELEDKFLKEYYNDNDRHDYYDERKEYIKKMIYYNIYKRDTDETKDNNHLM